MGDQWQRMSRTWRAFAGLSVARPVKPAARAAAGQCSARTGSANPSIRKRALRGQGQQSKRFQKFSQTLHAGGQTKYRSACMVYQSARGVEEQETQTLRTGLQQFRR